MRRQSGNKMTSVKAFIQYIIEKQQSITYLIFEETIRQAEIIFIIKNVQIINHTLIGDISSGETYNLIEDRQSITHTTVCLHSYHVQRSYNIHELDAASNNSVDDIRQLVEQVRIPPQIGKYKVYIIDEVHMLSASAFNAFLKTLEEPPRHAIFILATTEKHKILPTILSRCQIYDYNRISVEDTVNHLSYVASKEGITAGCVLAPPTGECHLPSCWKQHRVREYCMIAVR